MKVEMVTLERRKCEAKEKGGESGEGRSLE